MSACVFDMDGVLFDTERRFMECWQQEARRRGVLSDASVEEVYRSVIGTNDLRTREMVLKAWGEDFPFDDFLQKSFVLLRARNEREGMPVKPGAQNLLKQLRENGFRIGLATSTKRSLATEEMKAAGLLSFFDHLTCGDELRASKPEPDIYLATCEGLGVRPEETYAIEDSYFGIQAAHAAGMRAIMVPDLLPPTQEMQALCFAILPDLDAVGRLLLEKTPTE